MQKVMERAPHCSNAPIVSWNCFRFLTLFCVLPDSPKISQLLEFSSVSGNAVRFSNDRMLHNILFQEIVERALESNQIFFTSVSYSILQKFPNILN